MSKHMKRPIGVCSWSMRDNFDDIASLKLEYIHLAIQSALGDEGEATLKKFKSLPMKITSTMISFPQEDYSTLETIRKTGGIVPDDCWDRNRSLFLKGIEVTSKLPTKHMSCHFGFIDVENPSALAKLSARMTELADAAAAKNLTLLMETGQESAEHLRTFLEKVNHPAIKVNFDPANMILYGKGNPIAAVKVLAPWIRHVHIKDAIASATPGQWGREVAWGDGEVNSEAFLTALDEINYTGPLVIEREAGEKRFEDVNQAIRLITA
jgi:sugar phosphate isomerase/epimerase